MFFELIRQLLEWLLQILGLRTNSNYRFHVIKDKYATIEQVQEALQEAGLESSNLILGIDFTRSNTFTGEKSFEGRCLHDTTGPLNPYQQVISIIGRTLEIFDDDKLIPTFGFGDVHTTDKSCFPFFPDRSCFGFHEVLSRYIQIAPEVELYGPTNFAPVINKSIEIVRNTRSYHILVLIADGQVTCERETIDAIVQASSFPLSIVMVGVGDGPWDMMRRFDDELPRRRFDNFQFVCFNDVLRRFRVLRKGNSWTDPQRVDAYFAMCMLTEIPEQYKAIQELRLLSNLKPEPSLQQQNANKIH